MYLHLVHLLLDRAQVGAHGGHVAQFDHSVVQPVKHGLEGAGTV